MEDGSATPAPAARQFLLPGRRPWSRPLPRRRYHQPLSFSSPAFPRFPGPQHGPYWPPSSGWPADSVRGAPPGRHRHL